MNSNNIIWNILTQKIQKSNARATVHFGLGDRLVWGALLCTWCWWSPSRLCALSAQATLCLGGGGGARLLYAVGVGFCLRLHILTSLCLPNFPCSPRMAIRGLRSVHSGKMHTNASFWPSFLLGMTYIYKKVETCKTQETIYKQRLNYTEG